MIFTRQMELRERLADLGHERWVHWAKIIMPYASPGRNALWRQRIKLSYAELSEERKDYYRYCADKILELIKEFQRDGR